MSSDSVQESRNRSWFEEISSFFIFWDERFEDYNKENAWKNVFRDFTAAVVVALVAIPLGIGFSIASGMRPEQGIIAGAVAGILGGVFGGSKYQVYGPTAAFIPIISGIVNRHGEAGLLISSIAAGIIICLMGFFRLGKYFQYVPFSVIVGFTMGIAVTIVISQMPYVLGETEHVGYHALEKLSHVPNMFVDAHAHAIVLAVFTFLFVRRLVKISIYIPAALIAMLICTFVANNIWHDHLIPVVSSQYGDIGGHLLRFTPPDLSRLNPVDLFWPTMTITFIGALESLLSSRMADRLAKNPTPYRPNKELFGQGIVNIIVPLLNGFPCTGALARTATNIKLGAVSPLSSIFKGLAVITMMECFAGYLSSVPMAYVGGLLIFVAFNMVKPEEVAAVVRMGKIHVILMLYTAVMTLITDLSTAVASAVALFYVVKLLARNTHHAHEPVHLETVAVSKNGISNKFFDECPQCGYRVNGETK